MYLTIDNPVNDLFVVNIRNDQGRKVLSSTGYNRHQNAMRSAKSMLNLTKDNLSISEINDELTELNLVSNSGRVVAGTGYTFKNNAYRAKKQISNCLPLTEIVDNTY